MSTQQDIYDTGSKTRPPMLNKENYVPWSSRLLRYAKSRPNGKLIYNSIINGPYVRRMIPEPGDPDREVLVNETFHEQKDDELTEKELKQIYAAVNSCETAQEIWLRVQQMMKGSDIGIQEKKAKLFNEWEMFTSTDGESIESYHHRSQRIQTKLLNTNQRISSNPRNRQIAQLGMNMGQDRQMQMVGDCSEAVQNPNVQNVGNQNGLIVVPGIANQNPKWNGNVVAARAEVRPRRRDVAYLQTQLLIAQKEEAVIELQAEEFDLMVAAGDLDEVEQVNANYILMANLQQASTPGTQTDKAPVYDSDGSAKVQIYESCYNNDIFNMFTQEEQYIELLKSIPEPYQVQQNDSNVIFEKLRKSTRSIARKVLDIKIKKSQLFEISQEKYDKLERCYQKSVYQEQCLTKKINALNLSSGKQITTLNEEIENLNTQLSKEKSTFSSLQEEKKRLKSDFKIREDELLDKQIQLENKIEELDNILVKTGQSIQKMHMLSPKPDLFYHTEQKMDLGYQNPFYLKQAQQKQQSLYTDKVLLEKHDPPIVYDSEETLQLAQESRLKMKQLNKEIKPANYAKINHLSGIFVSQTAKSREDIFQILPKRPVYTQLASSVHQETHKIVKDDIFPIVNQVDARVQNFEIQFLKEAAKFVRDFKSLAKEADESLAKHKALELEIERLLRAIVSQDIMSIMQNPSVVDTSNLQTELERTKERFEICINKKENENTTKFRKPPSSYGSKLYAVTPFPKSKGLPKIDESHALSKPVTSNSIPTFKLGVESTAKTRRPQPRSNIKNDRVPSASKSSCIKNKNVELTIPNDKSEVVCAMCKQCLITANHVVCVLNYVNDMNSRDYNQSANVSNVANQKKHKPKVRKSKKLGSKERLASPTPSKPRSCLRWSPTRRIFGFKGKIIATSESECQSDSSKGDNACTYNPQEPTIKQFMVTDIH
ncbi:hypothetical protein Tco_1113853 [Tanacetum coccineum]|uniref:Integrase, catalytic region, zinc finger, CCHC-type, peptidase aspartic, catalytic n=1 Tax=Tanacetum coccineum TaxID=301880 RepID=A0ABQ5IUV2_9ASTR